MIRTDPIFGERAFEAVRWYGGFDTHRIRSCCVMLVWDPI